MNQIEKCCFADSIKYCTDELRVTVPIEDNVQILNCLLFNF